jgi:hypothetical protein
VLSTKPYPATFNPGATYVSLFFTECCPEPNMPAVKQPTNTPQTFVYWESKCGVGYKSGDWIIKTRLKSAVVVLGQIPRVHNIEKVGKPSTSFRTEIHDLTTSCIL